MLAHVTDDPLPRRSLLNKQILTLGIWTLDIGHLGICDAIRTWEPYANGTSEAHVNWTFKCS